MSAEGGGPVADNRGHRDVQHTHSIGEHLISVNVVRKAPGDKVVSQWAVQRWFETADEAARALRYITSDLVIGSGNGHGVSDPRHPDEVENHR